MTIPDTTPRFGFDTLLGNEVVDFNVIDANYAITDAKAAHLDLGNVFSQVQTIHRPAAANPALSVRLDADSTPRLSINADGSLAWAGGGAISSAGGALTISSTTLNVGSTRFPAGAAATPSIAFTSDAGTGLFNPSAGILGISVSGAEVDRIDNTGTIRFNRTNAQIGAYTSDDPATPGQRLVVINALTVTPGRLYAASLTVNGPSVHNGATTVSGGLNASGNSIFNQSLQVSGDLNAYGGRVNFEPSNAVYIQWRGDLGALYIPYGNGIYTSGITDTGPLNVSGSASIGNRLVVGGYDAGWQVNLAAGATGVITNGRFYQRGNGSFYCYDAGDFSYGVGIAANTLVQRDGAGQIQTQAVYMPSAAQGGKPAYVVGQSGDGWMRWWPANAIGPPVNPIVLFTHYAGGTSSNYDDRIMITADRSGYWIAVVNFNYNMNNNGDIAARFRMGSTITPQALIKTYGPSSAQFGWFSGYSGPYTPGIFLNAGETMSFQWSSNQPTGAAADMWAMFIPTANYNGV